MSSQKARIERAGTKIYVPAEEPKIVVAHPFFGPANSLNLQTQIRSKGLVEPTSRDVVQVAHALYGGSEPEEQDFTRIMRDNYVRAFTGILFDSTSKVAHFIDRPRFTQDSVVNASDLAQRVGESYAQVPFEHFQDGPVDWKEVAKDPYFVAFAHGQEGAEMLAELASKHPTKQAYKWAPSVGSMNGQVARVASLGSGRSGRLVVGTFVLGDSGGGYSFGVYGAEGAKAAESDKASF